MAHVRIFFLCRWASSHLLGVDLPRDVGGAEGCFPSQRSIRKILRDAIVEAEGVLVRIFTAAPTACFRFGISRFAKQDLIAVGRCLADHAFVENPSGDVAILSE